MTRSGSPGRALIEVRELFKRYGDKLVLAGFELRVARGETCVIIGGSGSGKSTFVRLLVGLERPDSGEIWVDGVDVAAPRTGRRSSREIGVLWAARHYGGSSRSGQ